MTDAWGDDGPDAVYETRSYNPEDNRTFRCARLLLLLETAYRDGRTIASMDRLAYYEFFSDNPWIVISDESASEQSDRDTLAIAGFSRTQLSYASTGPRFASRRERIRSDLAQVVSYGLVRLEDTQFAITDRGHVVTDHLQSAYADAYRASASLVLGRLTRLSNRAL